MKIDVHMLAFMGPEDVRHVEVPDGEFESAIKDDKLSIVFKLGQNDFQTQQMPSVSVGDVIELNNEYHLVLGAGFRQITKAKFEELKKTSPSVSSVMEAYNG